jgi:hypothetical protein
MFRIPREKGATQKATRWGAGSWGSVLSVLLGLSLLRRPV